MSLVLEVVPVSGGFAIKVKSGELPNPEKNKRYLEHVYKYKHVAESRKNEIQKQARGK
jgi:hypothetical protein